MDYSERIEKLKFYTPGDEAEELFLATCSLAYQMNGIGDPAKVEILVQWAEEMAKESKEWAESELEPEEIEYVSGHWGY